MTLTPTNTQWDYKIFVSSLEKGNTYPEFPHPPQQLVSWRDRLVVASFQRKVLQLGVLGTTFEYATRLLNKDVVDPTIAAHDGSVFIAWTGENKHIHLAAVNELPAEQFSLQNIFVAAEASDLNVAIGSHRGKLRIAWRQAVGDQNPLHFATVQYSRSVSGGISIAGLGEHEVVSANAQNTLRLGAFDDHWFVTWNDDNKQANFTFAAEPASNLADALPDFAASDARAGNGGEIRALHPMDVAVQEFPNLLKLQPRFAHVMGPGWFSLYLCLKDGRPEEPRPSPYNIHQNAYWALESFNSTAEYDGGDVRRVQGYTGDREVRETNRALAAVNEAWLREAYNNLRQTIFAARLNEQDFQAVLKELQALQQFYQRVDDAGLGVVCRIRHEMPKVLSQSKEPEPLPVLPADPAAMDPAQLEPYAPCIDSFGVAPNHPDNEWPWNIVSKKAVASAVGRIAREGDPTPQAYAAEELALGWAISREFARSVSGAPRARDLAPFFPLFLPANVGSPAADRLTPEVVRTAFRGVLHPWAVIDVAPLATGHLQRLLVSHDATQVEKIEAERICQQVLPWFESRPKLHGHAFVEIESYMAGPNFLKLVVALTRSGSLVGVAAVRLFHLGDPREHRQKVIDSCRFYAKSWFERGSDRFLPRCVLKAVDAHAFAQWQQQLAPRLKKLREAVQPIHWRSHFRGFPAQSQLALSPMWGTLHRCLSCGFFNPQYEAPTLPNPFFGNQARLSFGDDSLTGWDPTGVKNTADLLAGFNEAAFRTRYRDLRATDYAPFMSEADLADAVQTLAGVTDFYRRAADEGLKVLCHITQRTEEALDVEAAETLAPIKKVKTGQAAASGRVSDCVADDKMLAPLLPCMETYGVEEDDADWPHNAIAVRTVAYTCGRLALGDTAVVHDHEPGELERCRTLAREASKLVKKIQVISDQMGPFLPFFVTANVGDAVPPAITADVLRAYFGGTICPDDPIEIVPQQAAGWWWQWYVTRHGESDKRLEKYQAKLWQQLIDWFAAQPGLHAPAFVSIGLSEDDRGANHPRLAVALTDKGSLVGICGYVTFA